MMRLHCEKQRCNIHTRWTQTLLHYSTVSFISCILQWYGCCVSGWRPDPDTKEPVWEHINISHLGACWGSTGQGDQASRRNVSHRLIESKELDDSSNQTQWHHYRHFFARFYLFFYFPAFLLMWVCHDVWWFGFHRGSRPAWSNRCHEASVSVLHIGQTARTWVQTR